MNDREEAAAVVARMSLAEKTDFNSGADFWYLPAKGRLGQLQSLFAAGLSSPDSSDIVRVKRSVDGDNGEVTAAGLRDQHPVERIAMRTG